MKKQLIWLFESRKSAHYWWSYISVAPEYRVNLHARPSIIQLGCPTCYQVCALDHAKGGTADLDYPLEPCHCNVTSISSGFSGTFPQKLAHFLTHSSSWRYYTLCYYMYAGAVWHACISPRCTDMAMEMGNIDQCVVHRQFTPDTR